MDLRLYNTKTRSVEVFAPLNAPTVTMYACGPTVYDKTHIGHMRKYIGDDILRRTLTYLGYSVNHVMNITDVGHLTNDSDEGDDKFEKKAELEGKSVWDVAAHYTDIFHKSMMAVNVLPPTTEVKATDHIDEMIQLVQVLIDKGFAYETDQAVYFDVGKDPDYGSLSGQKLADKITAARSDVVVDDTKHHPADFALWFKRVGRFEHHTMYWQSPWGAGFPGWHIECSAMAMHYLGETIDIHTGGIDHIPVHHENEIAQSECATGHEFVRYWVHHDFLTVDGEKMSKSKQNFYTIEDIIEHSIDPLAVRLLAMSASYRKPLNFTWDALATAQTSLKKLQAFASLQKEVGSVIDSYKDSFIEALSDDINTAKALAVVWQLLGDSSVSAPDKWATLLSVDEVLGLGLDMVPKKEEKSVTPEAQELVAARDLARANKDFATSDELRKNLEAMGYEVVDTPDGTKLH
jgi:cysteinyl-tRNA synthetase